MSSQNPPFTTDPEAPKPDWLDERIYNAVFRLRPDGRIFEVNDVACKRLGYTREELIQLTVSDVDPMFKPDMREPLWQDLRKVKSLTVRSIHQRKDGSQFPVELTINHVETEDEEYEITVAQDITDRLQHDQALRDSEEHYRQLAKSNQRLLSEVNHRVRNNLTGLLSLLKLTRKNMTSVEKFADTIQHRITAMNHVHNLLADTQWRPLDLYTLIRRITRGYCPHCQKESHIHIEGSAVTLTPRQAVPLAMAINELLINSTKHGCQRFCDGKLHVTWQKKDHMIVIDWRETQGPPITQTVTPSLGTELIEGFVRFELAGQVEFRYPEHGVHHTLHIPSVQNAESQDVQF